jgi:hypothetical protein
MKATHKKGLPPGYSEKNIPGNSGEIKLKAASGKQKEMTFSLMEMPGGKPLPGDKK